MGIVSIMFPCDMTWDVATTQVIKSDISFALRYTFGINFTILKFISQGNIIDTIKIRSQAWRTDILGHGKTVFDFESDSWIICREQCKRRNSTIKTQLDFSVCWKWIII